MARFILVVVVFVLYIIFIDINRPTHYGPPHHYPVMAEGRSTTSQSEVKSPQLPPRGSSTRRGSSDSYCDSVHSFVYSFLYN